MEDIIAHARELGKKIASHPRCAQFMAAARAVAEDNDAQQVLKTYQEQARRIHELESAGKPIEAEDKRKLADGESKVACHPKLKDMLKHQADYLEMMTHINQAIDEASQNAPPKE